MCIQEFEAAVPFLLGLALSSVESQQRAALRALLEIYKLVHRASQVPLASPLIVLLWVSTKVHYQ